MCGADSISASLIERRHVWGHFEGEVVAVHCAVVVGAMLARRGCKVGFGRGPAGPPFTHMLG